ncbi:hypothetical protein NDU88_004731 [Pleurodeles waltl]|uniref:Uncharacterized protein n=1 Tax=Pleurodeles waltl TaxID=8319 RepID=A0AAV7MVZ3_PLEWA|nr:hypothetical protein NDU88_004731 [Pleurodeles waltl]
MKNTVKIRSTDPELQASGHRSSNTAPLVASTDPKTSIRASRARGDKKRFHGLVLLFQQKAWAQREPARRAISVSRSTASPPPACREYRSTWRAVEPRAGSEQHPTAPCKETTPQSPQNVPLPVYTKM